VVIRQKAPTSKIGGKANGDGEEVTEVDEEAEVRWDRLGVTPEAVEDVDVVTLLTMTPLRVTGVGCEAILPVTAPKNLYHRREVAIPALPKDHSLTTGKKSHVDEDVGVRSVSGA